MTVTGGEQTISSPNIKQGLDHLKDFKIGNNNIRHFRHQDERQRKLLRKAMSSKFYQEPLRRFDKSAVGGIVVQMSKQKVFVSRETYTLFDLAGDIGGAGELIFIVVNVFVGLFSDVKLGALAAKSLYTKGNANIQKPKSLATQLKGTVKIGKTVYFGFTPAQIQKKEQEKLNKNLKNLNL